MQQEIKIESGIPIPPTRMKGGSNDITLASMKIGDSFEYRGHASRYQTVAKRIGIEITLRSLGPKHYHVWRTA